MLQASGTDGAAFRRRTSTQGETRGGLNLLYRPQACIFRLPASAPWATHPPAPASRPAATPPPLPVASYSRRRATPEAAVPSPAVTRVRSRRRDVALRRNLPKLDKLEAENHRYSEFHPLIGRTCQNPSRTNFPRAFPLSIKACALIRFAALMRP
jgi:hypothetical protein